MPKVCTAFNKRLWSATNETPRSWAQLFIWCFQKEAGAKRLDKFRPISLIAAMAKWYDRSLTMLMASALEEVKSRSWGFAEGASNH